MKENKTYWFCQLGGWSGMIAIDTINYVYFIYGQFNVQRFWLIVSYAVFGILITHLFRYILKRTRFFQKKTSSIWFIAVSSTLLISFILSMLGLLGNYVHETTEVIDKLGLIFYLMGATMNWIRYVSVWVIIYFMYKVIQQTNTIEQEKLMLENLAKTTELELLKLQLNPHFLFNALNSIKALVVINPEQSRDAIVKLSDLLRFTLQYGKEQFIPIRAELTEVKKYLDLEQLRFGQRLSIRYEINENTFSQTIPPALVLTLAENAIKHGAARQISACTVTIRAFLTDDSLVVQVMNPGRLETNETTGYGLKHIRKRLEEMYHHKAMFTIQQQNEQVVATIQTPLSWQ